MYRRIIETLFLTEKNGDPSEEWLSGAAQ